jgi:hypothetical protein
LRDFSLNDVCFAAEEAAVEEVASCMSTEEYLLTL